jgi:hypothetical protein
MLKFLGTALKHIELQSKYYNSQYALKRILFDLHLCNL